MFKLFDEDDSGGIDSRVRGLIISTTLTVTLTLTLILTITVTVTVTLTLTPTLTLTLTLRRIALHSECRLASCGAM